MAIGDNKEDLLEHINDLFDGWTGPDGKPDPEMSDLLKQLVKEAFEAGERCAMTRVREQIQKQMLN